MEVDNPKILKTSAPKDGLQHYGLVGPPSMKGISLLMLVC